MKVALFIPCLTERFDARVAEATLLLLRHLGVSPVIPSAQTCCGQPLHTLGDPTGARRLAARMAKVFAPFDAVVSPSASCVGFIRHRDTPVGDRVFELSDFLASHLAFDASRATWPGRVAIHPSCHGREVALTGRADHTSALLSAVDGLELVGLPRERQCCGFGGAFSTAFSAVSVALGEDKLASFDESAATTLVVNDGGCRLHLRGLLEGGREREPVEVKHLAEILAEGLGLMPRPPRLPHRDLANPDLGPTPGSTRGPA